MQWREFQLSQLQQHADAFATKPSGATKFIEVSEVVAAGAPCPECGVSFPARHQARRAQIDITVRPVDHAVGGLPNTVWVELGTCTSLTQS